MDFTVNLYRKLLDQLLKSGYTFQTFTEFLEKPDEKVILLRHDVDDKKLNSLRFAQIQHELGIKGTYYFRMVPQSYDEKVIKKIADLGHEIGYHYEDMDFASSKSPARLRHVGEEARSSKLDEEGLYDVAIEIFKENLETLRKLYPVQTICMHGSPRSPFDNKAVWKKYDYKDYGIIGEPYFDIDFNRVFYLTDTGRRWDGEKVSVRDKVDSSKFEVRGSKPASRTGRFGARQPDGQVRSSPAGRAGSKFTGESEPSTPHPAPHNPHPAPRTPFLTFHSTKQIITAAAKNELPDQIMFTFHPQRWTNKLLPWMWEFIFQNLKNQVKRYLINKK